MSRKLLVLLASSAFAACSGEAPTQGAVRAVVAWEGFSPGCLELTAHDAVGGTSTKSQTTLTLSAPERSGERVFAVFQKEGWGEQIALTARAFEGACTDGIVVARTETTATASVGEAETVPAQTLTLTAADVDADGFVDANAELPGSDCDDASAAVRPGATEACDGQDNDCDGQTDEDVQTPFFRDADEDGHGDPALTALACGAPAGYVAEGDDCDDANADISPSATEVCNGVDDTCNDQIDEGLGATLWYPDLDEDGFGDPAGELSACSEPAGYVTEGGDCNDGNADVFPGATEICNGLDDDCDGSTDEGVLLTFYRDQDADTFGDDAQVQQACAQPSGYVTRGGDCDDGRTAVNPDATETCNTLDDDCDGSTDEGVLLTFHRDQDGDTWGSPTQTQQACAPSTGWVVDATDCNDGNANVFPGATEVCNGVDDDCDAATDEGVKLTFYRDADGDTWGTSTNTQEACAPPAGYVSIDGDCNDAAAAVNPAATETCNGVDDDCDGTSDVGIGTTWYEDFDGDGDGLASSTTLACSVPAGYAATSTDCDDGNPFRNAQATERCDGMDNDCDGTADNGLTCTGAGWTAAASSGGGGHEWRSIHVYAPGKAWVAGRGNRLKHFDGTTTTTDFDGDCSGAWEGAWSNGAGVVYLGASSSGSLAWHDGGPSCKPAIASGSGDLRGLVGLSTANGPTVFAVGSDGKVIRWQTWMSGASGVSPLFQQSNLMLWDIDARSTAGLIAVGATGSTPVPAVLRRTGASTFVQDPLPAGLSGYLRRVSVVKDDLAFAVGDGGVVLAFAGGAWFQLPSPPGATSLHGALAFGSTLLYVAGTTASDNRVWRYDENGWTTVHTIASAKVPNDLGGTAPWDLWVVGNSGLVERFSD